MSRGGRRLKWGSEPTTTTNLDGIWGLNEINNLIGQTKWPRGPVAPTSLSAAAGNAQLSLSWTAPATTHGTITNYLVEYTASGGSAQYVLTNSTSTSYTLTGLTNGTEYTVRVAAVNFTAGDYSNAVTGTPNALVITGGTVTTPGDGYTYRTFTSNGTLVVSGASLLCDVLVVGGGGGRGAWWINSGGGGGGVRLSNNHNLSPNSYSVVVGVGGSTTGGGLSSIAGLSATGGTSAGVGPSGYGGGSGGTSGIPTSTSNSTGNAGGAGSVNGDDSSGGGGGGAGGAGGNTNGLSAVGGAGVIVWGVEYGRGGRGGADPGNESGNPVIANRGMGAQTDNSGISGSAGVVIIRYLST